MDFELTPSYSSTIVLSEVETEDEDIVSGLMVCLEAVGGNMEAPTCTSRELQVETTAALLESGIG